jgi:hypothetical protein
MREPDVSSREFNQLLNSLGSLSADQLAALRRELDIKLAPPRPTKSKRKGNVVEDTVFDLLDRAGLIGCVTGRSGSPTDLSTNPTHMEGFGGG